MVEEIRLADRDRHRRSIDFTVLRIFTRVSNASGVRRGNGLAGRRSWQSRCGEPSGDCREPRNGAGAIGVNREYRRNHRIRNSFARSGICDVHAEHRNADTAGNAQPQFRI